VNSLYHFRSKRGGVVWIQEHDLIVWLSGINMRTKQGEDTLVEKMRMRLNYFFFGVRNTDDFFTKVRNVIYSCEDPDVRLIRREKAGSHEISDRLNLTTRGEEIYPYSHLIGIFFGNYWVKWALTGLIVWILGKHIVTINF
jgi:hypothetical protein